MTLGPAGTADGGTSPVVWLVRHGRPLLPDGVCYGALDVAADPLHTARIAAMLEQQLPRGAALCSSPLQRCMALSRAVVALRSDLTLRTEPRIAEVDFGQWEGWRWDDIPKAAFDTWIGQFADHRFGGGESVQDLMLRVGQVWDEARASATVQVWITHAGVMSAATLLARGIRSVFRAEDWPSPSPRHGELLGLVDQSAISVVRGRA
jgi:alpha-ribazole phosphatase